MDVRESSVPVHPFVIGHVVATGDGFYPCLVLQIPANRFDDAHRAVEKLLDYQYA